jgi:predicted nucleotidyltransferase
MNRQEPVMAGRRNLADKIAHRYREIGDADVMMVIGSVGYGWADELSDVDLLIAWQEIPRAEERSALLNMIADAGTRYVASDEFYEESRMHRTNRDMFLHSGILIDVHHVTTDALEQLVHSVVEPSLPETLNSEAHILWFRELWEGKALFHNEQICSALQSGIILFDPEGRVALWRKSLSTFAKLPYHRVSAALWSCLDFYTAWWNPRIMVLRVAICYLAWTMARRVPDVLWLISLLSQKHMPGISFSGNWLPPLECANDFHQALCDVVRTSHPDTRVKKWVRLVEDIGSLIQERLAFMDLPHYTARLLAENAIRICIHEEEPQTVEVIKKPHDLPENYEAMIEMITEEYAQHDFVLAFGIFGSVAKGYVDGWSDMDLFLFCHQMPSEDLRSSILSSLCPDGRWNLKYEDTDVLYIDDIWIHIEHCTLQDGEWRGTPITLYPEMESARALFDPTGLVSKVKEQIRAGLYERCEKRILTEKLPGILRHWHPAFRAAHRGDVIAFTCHISALVAYAFPILSYLNESEVSYLKWAESHLARLSLKPQDAADRLRYILIGDEGTSLVDRWSEWCRLYNELMDLVAQAYPEIGVSIEAIRWLCSQTAIGR